MAKKKLGNPFTGEGISSLDTSFEAADATLFGEIAKVDEGRQVAKPISIFEIMPDVTQPRRAIPSVVRERWDSNPHTLDKLFGVWLDMAQEEKGAAVDLSIWLEGVSEDEESPDEEAHKVDTPQGALETALMQIVELAASIKRDGLTNPITVVQDGTQYLLETGERRWLAYHLLFANYREEKWTKIPARVVDHFNVWRQATENTARADLNAIGKARQYAILMMDLWLREPDAPVHFRPITDFPSERAFYAQVAHLSTPYGKSKLLLNAIGAKTPTAFHRRRKLLNLPDEAWRIADDYNLSEDTLIALDKRPVDEIVGEIQRLAQIFPSRKDSDFERKKPETVMPASPLLSKQHKSNLSRVWKIADRAAHGETSFSDRDINALAKLRRWLDEVESMIQSRQGERKK